MKRKTIFALLLTLSAAILSVSLIDRPFYSRGEPREALVAQSMISSGNLILPRAYSGEVPSKPPFLHWLMVASSRLTGSLNEISARLPSALAFTIFLPFFFLFVSRRSSVGESFFASLVLLSTVGWLRSGVSCRVDTLFAISLSATFLSLFAWWERGFRGFSWASLIFLSIAALTKGPVAFILGCGALLLFVWLKDRQIRSSLIACIKISLPALLIASLWYIAAYRSDGDAFSSKVWYENIARFAGTQDDEPHKHTVFYLLGTLILGILPWSLVLLTRLFSGIPRFKGAWSSLVGWWRSLIPLEAFSVIVLVVVFCFFAIPSGKRDVYLLPAYPFICIVAARLLYDVTRSGLITAKVLTAILTALPILLLVIGSIDTSGIEFISSDVREYIKVLSPIFISTGMWWLIIGGILTFILICGRHKSIRSRADTHPHADRALFHLAVVIITFGFVTQRWLVNPACEYLSFREWSKGSAAKSLVAKGNNLFSYHTEFYGISFYLKKPIQRITDALPETGTIFLERRDLAELETLAAKNPRVSLKVVQEINQKLVPDDRRVLVVQVGTALPA